jgi:hypothetical protein
VEVLIVDGDWGHYLTVTGLAWNDANNNLVIDGVENAFLNYIDPATGAPGSSPIAQAGLGMTLFVGYGPYNGQIVMSMSQVPEPGSLCLLIVGVFGLMIRRRR